MTGKNLRKKILMIDFNVLYTKTEKNYPAYISKHYSNREKQVILLMIEDKEKRHYIVVKTLAALLRGKTSKHNRESM